MSAIRWCLLRRPLLYTVKFLKALWRRACRVKNAEAFLKTIAETSFSFNHLQYFYNNSVIFQPHLFRVCFAQQTCCNSMLFKRLKLTIRQFSASIFKISIKKCTNSLFCLLKFFTICYNTLNVINLSWEFPNRRISVCTGAVPRGRQFGQTRGFR